MKKITAKELREQLRHMISGEAPFLSESAEFKLLGAALLEILERRQITVVPPTVSESPRAD